MAYKLEVMSDNQRWVYKLLKMSKNIPEAEKCPQKNVLNYYATLGVCMGLSYAGVCNQVLLLWER